MGYTVLRNRIVLPSEALLRSLTSIYVSSRASLFRSVCHEPQRNGEKRCFGPLGPHRHITVNNTNVPIEVALRRAGSQSCLPVFSHVFLREFQAQRPWSTGCLVHLPA